MGGRREAAQLLVEMGANGWRPLRQTSASPPSPSLESMLEASGMKPARAAISPPPTDSRLDARAGSLAAGLLITCATDCANADGQIGTPRQPMGKWAASCATFVRER